MLVDEGASVLSRFNRYDLDDGTAVLGYRVAQQAAGRGVATATVHDLCRLIDLERDQRRARLRRLP